MAKHIKFQENIEEDDAYSKDFVSKNDFSKFESTYDDEDFGDESSAPKWYDQIPDDPQDFKPISENQINALLQEAKTVIHGASLAHETKMSKVGSSDQKWARSLLSKGAMADRVAAATVLIQDSPMYNLTTLQNLVSMVKPAKKKDSLTVIETLTELFVADMLIPDRKLRKFEQRPLSELEKMCSGNKDHRKKILTYWIFEHLLKETYGEFVKCLNTFAHDSVEAHKEKAVTAMAKLLMGNPELENVLLTNIVNKLGDPSQKVASKVIYQLSQVLFNHPNMKNVVLNEIERMLFRPNISPKAQYYGICFLNQFYLNKDDTKVAENLVRVYFSFFKACIKTGEVDTRLMGGILTGVRRCRPFLRDEAVEALQVHTHTLHKLVHLASYTIALQALALLFQLGPTDRYYNSLYKKLSHPETLTTTHPALLLGLIYRSLTKDESTPRVLAFLKRLLQLAALSEANRACAIMLVVARLSRRMKLPMTKEKQEEKAEIDKPELKNEEEEEGNKDDPIKETGNDEQAENKVESKKKKKHKKGVEDNKEESEENEKKVVEKQNQSSKNNWLIGDKSDLLNEEDGEEVYDDIPLEEDEEDHKKKLKNLMKKKEASARGWLFYEKDNKMEIKEEDAEKEKEDSKQDDKDKEKNLQIIIKRSKNINKVITEYDPYNRNPMFCGAEHSVMSELLLLKEHYHPSVRLFAEKIMQGSIIQYNGDPLKDFSVSHFLDRFAFKNPKKNASKADEHEVVQQVRGSHPKFAVRRNYTPGGLKSLRVNSAAYLNEDAIHIPVDERFLYDYLHMRRAQRGDTGQIEEDAESDAGSVDSEDFNKYLDGITGANKNKEAEESDDELEEEEMDYMKEMMVHKKLENGKKKNQKKSDEAAEEASDEDIGEEDDDNDMIDDGDSLDGDDFDIDDDDDGSDLLFSDDEDDVDDEEAMLDSKFQKSNKKGKSKGDESEDDMDIVSRPNKKKSKGGKKGINSMFASAEEFAELLEETGSHHKQGTSQAVATNDNANVKQLNWEDRRDRWVKGYSGNRGGRGRGRGGRGGHDRTNRNFNNKGSKSFDRKRKTFGPGRGGPNKKFKK